MAADPKKPDPKTASSSGFFAKLKARVNRGTAWLTGDLLGFEALSRGAAEVWFVEQDRALVAALTAQADVFDVRPRIVRQDVESLLRGRPPARFDVVFLDPPYAEPIEPLLELLPAWLAADGVIYVERPSESGLSEVPGAQWWKRSSAGAVEYGLLRYAGPAV